MLSAANNYKEPKYVIRYYFFRIIPKCFYGLILKHKYKRIFNDNLNLSNPQKLSEKINWLKLYDNNRKKTVFVDKLLVKKYIADNIKYLKTARVFQSCNSFKQLDFDKLPNKFVLKTNHAWRTNVFINDKNKLSVKDIKQIEQYYNWVLKINYAYWSYYELQYNHIKPKIYAEEYIFNSDEIKIIEYEVYCMNGNPEFIKISYYVKASPCDYYRIYFYDLNYKLTDFVIRYGNNYEEYVKSINFNRMIDYSRQLSKNFKFVRVDFMEANNELYFSEMTFTPYSGFIEFVPKQFDLILGSKLKL